MYIIINIDNKIDKKEREINKIAKKLGRGRRNWIVRKKGKRDLRVIW